MRRMVPESGKMSKESKEAVQVIHANLKLSVISTLDVSILLMRIVDFLDSSGQYDFGPTQNTIKKIVFSMGMLSLYNLLGERIFALYAYRWYDRADSARPHIIIIVYLLQFIVVLVAYRMVQNGGPTAAQIYVAALFGCAVVALVGTVIYMAIAHVRHDVVKQRRFDLSCHSISAQMIKNRRCDRFVLLYVPYQVILFLLTTLLGGILIFTVKQDPSSFLLSQSVLYLTLTPRVMFSMLLPVIRHPSLYKHFRSLFARRSTTESRERVLTASDQPKYIIVRCTRGKPLAFSPEQETNLYFENYTTSWGCTAEWNRMSR